jgi:hypothetical protein
MTSLKTACYVSFMGMASASGHHHVVPAGGGTSSNLLLGKTVKSNETTGLRNPTELTN